MATEKDNNNNSRSASKELQDKEARSVLYLEEIKNAIMMNGLIKILIAMIN